uniref:Ribosomal protein S1 n=1 Tax=Geranium brycei TaxID=379939 RepID=A0A0G3Y3X1_9ROSI|nr:ribosomal protein S1 [Geranium brycei]
MYFLYLRSNSSLLLCSGNALQSSVLRFRKSMYLVNAGLGSPRLCMQDEPTGVPIKRGSRFENKVGSQGLMSGESMIKELAAASFNDLEGSTDVVAGEPLLLLPRRFRQKLAWIELNKIWRRKTKVKGLILEKVKGGYLVAIAGFITFLPFRPFIRQRILNNRFRIESINPKSSHIEVY